MEIKLKEEQKLKLENITLKQQILQQQYTQLQNELNNYLQEIVSKNNKTINDIINIDLNNNTITLKE